ncbi:hypothetical protein D3C73_541950 [compost metagenome]
MFTYTGNGAYRYANSASMLLDAAGEKISTETIEVLSGVGLGAIWFKEDNMIFFSSGVPHTGVSKALDILGFTVSKHSSTDRSQKNAEILTTAIIQHPVMLGPLDMGYLSYLPNHRYLHGCDHYVLAFGVEDGMVRLHDPAGYPYAMLPMEELINASKTSQLQYRLYPQDLTYHYWCAPQRVKHPSVQDIYVEAIRYFRQVYKDIEGQCSERNWLSGSEAIEELKGYLLGGEPNPGLMGHLTHFAFQVSARRALGFGQFFQQKNTDLAKIKLRQAEVFGRCHTLAVHGDWHTVGEVLSDLAELEDKFQDSLFKS